MAEIAARTVADIQADFDLADAAFRAAQETRTRIGRDLNAAKIAQADHPWTDKEVCRVVRFGFRGQTRIQCGIVKIYDPAMYRGIRGLYAKPGDAIVVSKTGKSSWALKDGYRQVEDWALVEKSK